MSTFQYVQPTEEQKATMQKFRDKYEALANEIKQLTLIISLVWGMYENNK